MLALSVLVATLFFARFKKQAILPVRKIPLFLVLFGAANVASYMCGHLGEVIFRAIERAMAGTFVYDYKFYSLILMGVVFLGMALYMMMLVKEWLTGYTIAKKVFVKTALVLIVLSAPTFPFTPIGLLPTLSCIISLIALPFVIRVVEKPAFIEKV